MLAPTWPSLSMFSTCPYRRSTSAFLPHPSVSRSSFFNALSHDLSYFPLDGNCMEDREKQGNSIDDVARKGYFSRPRKYHKFWPRELLEGRERFAKLHKARKIAVKFEVSLFNSVNRWWGPACLKICSTNSLTENNTG